MTIAKHKHRYTMALTRSHVDRFKSLCRDLGIPETALSNAVDDFLVGMNEVLQVGKDQGQLGISEITRLMGTQMNLLQEEERKHEEQQKRNPDTR